MRDVLLGNERNTQKSKNLTAAGQAQGLRVPSRTLPCPCQPQLTETETGNRVTLRKRQLMTHGSSFSSSARGSHRRVHRVGSRLGGTCTQTHMSLRDRGRDRDRDTDTDLSNPKSTRTKMIHRRAGGRSGIHDKLLGAENRDRSSTSIRL